MLSPGIDNGGNGGDFSFLEWAFRKCDFEYKEWSFKAILIGNGGKANGEWNYLSHPAANLVSVPHPENLEEWKLLKYLNIFILSSINLVEHINLFL